MGGDEYRSPVTPFGGWVTDDRLGRLVPLETAPHILGLAPPGTGKTRRWLAQSAVLWPGPAVVSSSKDDLMQMVSSRRWDTAMLLDLRPITPPFHPREFTPCRYDPTALIGTLEDAQAAAETLLSMSSVGFGGTQARPAADNGMWENLAFAPLTCLLYAASPAATGLGMECVLESAEDVDIPPRWPLQVSTDTGGDRPPWNISLGRAGRRQDYSPHPRGGFVTTYSHPCDKCGGTHQGTCTSHLWGLVHAALRLAASLLLFAGALAGFVQ
jgi:type IV secretion system protein VirD4